MLPVSEVQAQAKPTGDSVEHESPRPSEAEFARYNERLALDTREGGVPKPREFDSRTGEDLRNRPNEAAARIMAERAVEDMEFALGITPADRFGPNSGVELTPIRSVRVKDRSGAEVEVPDYDSYHGRLERLRQDALAAVSDAVKKGAELPKVDPQNGKEVPPDSLGALRALKLSKDRRPEIETAEATLPRPTIDELMRQREATIRKELDATMADGREKDGLERAEQDALRQQREQELRDGLAAVGQNRPSDILASAGDIQKPLGQKTETTDPRMEAIKALAGSLKLDMNGLSPEQVQELLDSQPEQVPRRMSELKLAQAKPEAAPAKTRETIIASQAEAKGIRLTPDQLERAATMSEADVGSMLIALNESGGKFENIADVLAAEEAEYARKEARTAYSLQILGQVRAMDLKDVRGQTTPKENEALSRAGALGDELGLDRYDAITVHNAEAFAQQILETRPDLAENLDEAYQVVLGPIAERNVGKRKGNEKPTPEELEAELTKYREASEAKDRK